MPELEQRVPSLALLAELEQAGAISTIGLHLAEPDLSYDRFEALCALLGRLHEAVRFAIGDAILLGEKLYPQDCYQAFEGFGLSPEAMREYVRVAQRVPRSRRRKDLSWSHHRTVAALDPPEQKQWLRAAAEQGLSHHALRDALRNGQPATEVTTCRCCHRPLD